jgi:hypothetical protein
VTRLLDTLTFGRRRRYRRMMRQLHRLDVPRSRPRAAAAGLVAGVTALGVAGAVVAVPVAYRHARALLPVPVEAAAQAEVPRPEGWPPAGVGDAGRRLLPVVAAPAGTGGFRFENTQDDGRTPVGWDPCRPIRYVVSGEAPAGAERILREAVAQISEAAGLRFTFAGPTGERPTDKREPYQPDRYGEQWAPVLVAWSDPRESPDLVGDTMGLGGAWRFPEPTADGWGREGYVTGSVVLDRPQFVRVLRSGRSDAVAVARSVVVHELGHVLGLAHVASRRQLMHPETQPHITSLRGGDRRGLAALGRVACLPGL